MGGELDLSVTAAAHSSCVLGDGADTAERAGRVVLKPPTRDGSLSGNRRMILAGPTSGERASEADAAAAAAIIFFGGVLDAFSKRKGRRRVVGARGSARRQGVAPRWQRGVEYASRCGRQRGALRRRRS